MKTNFFILSVLMLLSSCQDMTKGNAEDSDENKQNISEITVNDNKLKGTWELIGFYNYNDNKVVDSFGTNPEFRQLKMFTNTKVMWCKHRPADSSEWFGYGTYNFDGDQLTEVLDFGSAIMDEVIAEKKQFVFDVKLENNRFEQIEIDSNGNRIYSENYKRIE